jgi:hypothetical protein
VLTFQAAALKRPPRTFEEVLDGLAEVVPDFVPTVRRHGSHCSL